MKKKIYIDAGHNYSSFNTGALGNGMREQDITFDVSFYLGEILKRHGFDIRLSRPTLQTNLGNPNLPSLQERNASAINARWQEANAWGADYFISIHANAGGGSGAETLFARNEDRAFAQTVQDVYSAIMGLRNRRIWQRQDIAVIRWTTMPAILLELAFIDALPTAPDVDILRNRRYEMAVGVAKGMLAYFGVDYCEKPTPANQANYWAQTAQKKAMSKGITDGLRPQHPATREELWVMFDRLGLLG